MAKRSAAVARETAPEYRVASRKEPSVVAPRRLAAPKSGGALERAWVAYGALDRASRDQFLSRVLEDGEILEDLLDLAIIESRRGERTRPIEEYFQERLKRGRRRLATK